MERSRTCFLRAAQVTSIKNLEKTPRHYVLRVSVALDLIVLQMEPRRSSIRMVLVGWSGYLVGRAQP